MTMLNSFAAMAVAEQAECHFGAGENRPESRGCRKSGTGVLSVCQRRPDESSGLRRFGANRAGATLAHPGAATPMRPRLSSMTAALAAGVTATVVIACACGAYLYSRHHLGSLLQHERGMALAQGELMRVALEHEMVENDRTLIANLVRAFGQEPRVSRVMLLDREGTVRYASGPPGPPEDFHLESPTCQACHRLPAARCSARSSRSATPRPARRATTRNSASTA
jgi:hypothetical protein